MFSVLAKQEHIPYHCGPQNRKIKWAGKILEPSFDLDGLKVRVASKVACGSARLHHGIACCMQEPRGESRKQRVI